MTLSLGKIANRTLRFVLSPLRLWKRKQAGPQPHPKKSMEVPNDILLPTVRQVIMEGHTATINVKGWSMRPFLEHLRDKVQLSHPDGASVGDAVLAEIMPGKFVLHRIIAVKPHEEDPSQDEITLMGDGNVLGTEHCHRCNLCGIVTQYIYPHKVVNANDPTLVRRIRRWGKLLPIRRYLLAVYRATL